MDETLRELEQLRATNRVLEEENSLLSERAEDTLLLSLVSEVVSTSTSAEELIPRVLERLSVLKDITFCACAAVGQSTATILAQYCQRCNAPGSGRIVSLPSEFLHDVSLSPVVLGRQEIESRAIPSTLFCVPPEPQSVGVIAFECRNIPSGLLILADDQRSAKDLSSLMALVGHILEMMIARLDNLSLMASLSELNARLDQRVAERTREVVQLDIQYRALFESVPDGVFLVNVEGVPGTIVSTNQAGATMHGYSRESLVGQSMSRICACYEGAKFQEKIDLLRHQPTLSAESMHRRSDGSEFPSETVERLLVIDHMPYLLSFHRDITERHRAEELIRLNERRLRSAQAMAHVGNWELDLRTKTMWASEEAFQIYGLARATEYLPLEQIQSQVAAEFRVDLDRALQQLMLHGGEYSVEFEMRRADNGELRWLHSKGERILSASGTPTHIVGVVQDITGQKQLQHQLAQSQRIQSIGTLAAGIAHDFNNILNIIMGYTSLLVSDPDNASRKTERLMAINQAVDRGAALVNQILVFARQAKTEVAPIDVEPVIRELLSMLKETFTKTISFREQYPDHVPLVLADKTQIHQAILNLCVNARDAMPSGGTISVVVQVVSHDRLRKRFTNVAEGAYVCVRVSDTGTGMSEERSKRVFDPFFTTKEKGKGTGLGLSVVYGIMQAHHGYVDLQSVMNVGSTFYLYLPVIADHEGPKAYLQTDGQSSSVGEETILIVEDEPLALDMIRLYLEANGYQVLTASDGKEAVDVFRAHGEKIDLVVTDMGLPVISGKEVFRKLREIDPSVSVLLASGFIEPEEREELIRMGVSGILLKPYAPQDFLKTLRRVLDGQA